MRWQVAVKRLFVNRNALNWRHFLVAGDNRHWRGYLHSSQGIMRSSPRLAFCATFDWGG